MRRLHESSLAVALSLLTACAGSPSTESSHVEAIRALLAGADRAFAAGDVDAIVAGYDDGAVLMAPDGPAIVGVHEIRQFYTTMLESFTGAHEMRSDEIVVFGDWALDRGTVEGTIRSKVDGAEYTIDNKYLYLLRRRPDGAWKYARVIWNAKTPPAPDAASQSSEGRQ